MTIEEMCTHWGITYSQILEYAARDLERLREETKRQMGFPQDGSSGQYDAWTRTLVAAVEKAAEVSRAREAQSEHINV